MPRQQLSTITFTGHRHIPGNGQTLFSWKVWWFWKFQSGKGLLYIGQSDYLDGMRGEKTKSFCQRVNNISYQKTKRLKRLKKSQKGKIKWEKYQFIVRKNKS
jgi:hypothetical protein